MWIATCNTCLRQNRWVSLPKHYHIKMKVIKSFGSERKMSCTSVHSLLFERFFWLAGSKIPLKFIKKIQHTKSDSKWKKSIGTQAQKSIKILLKNQKGLEKSKIKMFLWKTLQTFQLKWPSNLTKVFDPWFAMQISSNMIKISLSLVWNPWRFGCKPTLPVAFIFKPFIFKHVQIRYICIHNDSSEQPIESSILSKKLQTTQLHYYVYTSLLQPRSLLCASNTVWPFIQKETNTIVGSNLLQINFRTVPNLCSSLCHMRKYNKCQLIFCHLISVDNY